MGRTKTRARSSRQLIHTLEQIGDAQRARESNREPAPAIETAFVEPLELLAEWLGKTVTVVYNNDSVYGRLLGWTRDADSPLLAIVVQSSLFGNDENRIYIIPIQAIQTISDD